jgi:hypothetical protein
VGWEWSEVVRIVAGSDTPFAIGQRGMGCTDQHCEYHPDQPFIVLREVDRAAWLANLASYGIEPHDFELTHPRKHYYEIATD